MVSASTWASHRRVGSVGTRSWPSELKRSALARDARRAKTGLVWDFFWGGTEHPPIPMGYQQIINGLSMDYHPLMDHPFPMDYDG